MFRAVRLWKSPPRTNASSMLSHLVMCACGRGAAARRVSTPERLNSRTFGRSNEGEHDGRFRGFLGFPHEEAELELPVVGDDEGAPGLGGERRADAVAVLLEGRLVLEVRAARGEAARLGVEVERAVDAPVLHAGGLGHRAHGAILGAAGMGKWGA